MKRRLLRSPAAWLVALFLAAAALRLADLPRPVARPDWREADVAGIARNFYREGMNPFYPRVDWRGDGPGFAEMELPILPWSMAVLYHWTGVHEQVGRLLSLLASLAALAFFFLLARRRLPPQGAVIAAALFAFNPLVVELATALKPDGLMLAASLAAVYAFLVWLDGEERGEHRVAYWTAVAATALALLAKASAAHLGLLFGFVLLARWGRGALRKPALWGLGLALAPALLWYGHARRLWLRYGNSLGLSNESHWAGWDLFTDSSFVRGIVRAEVGWVWTIWGLVAVALWLWVDRSFRRHRFELVWLASVAVFYLVTARTSADAWATYYHVLSVPPAALLLGAACASLGWRPAGRGLLSGAAAVLAAPGLELGWLGAAELRAGEGAGGKLYLAVALLGGAGLLVVRALAGPAPGTGDEDRPRLAALFPVAAGLALAGALTAEARLLYWRAVAPAEHPLYACARSFAPRVSEGALLVASGGPCRDSTEFPVAYNKPYMFYWMDRKGFNVCREEQSLQAVGSMAARGAAYLVAEVADLDARPGLEGRLRRRYDLVAECEQALLLRLTPADANAAGTGGESRGHAAR